MSYWEDLDDHLRRLEPNDLNLDYMGVSHLDCVSRVWAKGRGDSQAREPSMSWASLKTVAYCILPWRASAF